MPILTGIYPSKRKGKRLTAYFQNPKKTIHFGSDNAQTLSTEQLNKKEMPILHDTPSLAKTGRIH